MNGACGGNCCLAFDSIKKKQLIFNIMNNAHHTQDNCQGKILDKDEILGIRNITPEYLIPAELNREVL